MAGCGAGSATSSSSAGNTKVIGGASARMLRQRHARRSRGFRKRGAALAEASSVSVMSSAVRANGASAARHGDARFGRDVAVGREHASVRGLQARRIVEPPAPMQNASAAAISSSLNPSVSSRSPRLPAATSGGSFSTSSQNDGADHQRMDGGAQIERVGGGVLDGFERGFGEAEFGKAIEVDARRAAQSAPAFDVSARAPRSRLRRSQARRGRRARRGEHAAEAAIVADCERGDAAERRKASGVDAEALRAGGVVGEGDGDRGAQARLLLRRAQVAIDLLRARGDAGQRARERRPARLCAVRSSARLTRDQSGERRLLLGQARLFRVIAAACANAAMPAA